MAKRDVALIVHDGVQALDVAGPLDVFAEANLLLPRENGYECLLLAADPAPIRASSGMKLVPDLAFSQAQRRFHTALVAGGPALPTAPENEAMSGWLRNYGTLAGRYGSICTGAFALGHAGLLDGRTVTTHWQNAAQWLPQFPAAHVEHDRIYARDGALVTSAGVTAGIDLALALVGEDHGGGNRARLRQAPGGGRTTAGWAVPVQPLARAPHRSSDTHRQGADLRGGPSARTPACRASR